MNTKFLNQAKLLGTVTPTNSAIAASDDGQVVAEKLQGQINALSPASLQQYWFTCEAQATANVTIANPGTDTFDGVTLTNGQSLFLATGIQTSNTGYDVGAYVFNGAAVPLTRILGITSWADLLRSNIIILKGGTLYGGKRYCNTNLVGGTIGSTAILYTDELTTIALAATNTYYLRGDGTTVGLSSIQAGDVPTLNQSTSGTAAKATNIAGGTAYQIPYQTDADTTSFISAGTSAVLVTDGSNVPSLSTTLPAVTAGAVLVTDPTTSSAAAVDTALSNVYGAIPPLTSYYVKLAAGVNMTVATGMQAVAGLKFTLPAGKYLVSYFCAMQVVSSLANQRTFLEAKLYDNTGAADVTGAFNIGCEGYTVVANLSAGVSATAIVTLAEESELQVYANYRPVTSITAFTVYEHSLLTAVKIG